MRASQGKEVKIHRQRTHLGILFLLLLVGTPAAAETLSGRVVGITDGDTLTLLTVDRVQVKVRLAEIDAPEAHQPYGQRAKQALTCACSVL